MEVKLGCSQIRNISSKQFVRLGYIFLSGRHIEFRFAPHGYFKLWVEPPYTPTMDPHRVGITTADVSIEDEWGLCSARVQWPCSSVSSAVSGNFEDPQ